MKVYIILDKETREFISCCFDKEQLIKFTTAYNDLRKFAHNTPNFEEQFTVREVRNENGKNLYLDFEIEKLNAL